jgi:thiol-disulfide isomerase/thioredoxin
VAVNRGHGEFVSASVRKVLSALVDCACGFALVAVAFLEARVLLHSRTLVYLAFPVTCTVAFAIGYWRGRRSELPFAVTVILATAPLFIVASQFFSGRNKPFIVLPIVAIVFIVLGGTIRRPAIAIGVLLVGNIAAAFAGPLFTRWIVPSADVVEKPVAFVLHTVDGRTISSDQLRGHIVVLDFWATWCVPCQHELPAIQRVYDATKHDSNVAIFAVDGVMTDSPGDSGDTAERAIAYFHRGSYSIPLAWDGGGVLENAFALHGFPTLLILDGRGQVRMRHVGFMGSEDLEGLVLRKIRALGS